jgi:tetratricopeptide (TPR) repeat protein
MRSQQIKPVAQGLVLALQVLMAPAQSFGGSVKGPTTATTNTILPDTCALDRQRANPCLQTVQSRSGLDALAAGDAAEALETFQRDMRLAKKLAMDDPDDPWKAYQVAELWADQSRALRALDRPPDALGALLTGLAQVADLRARFPKTLLFSEANAVFLNNLAAIQVEEGDLTDALASYQFGSDMMVQVARGSKGPFQKARRYYGAMANMHKAGKVLELLDDPSKALCAYVRAHAYAAKATRLNSDNALYRRGQHINGASLENLRRQLGDATAPDCGQRV